MADDLNRYRLVYDGVDFAFGDLDSGYPFTEQVQVTPGNLRQQDSDNPAGDGRRFGIDWWGGDSYGFTVAVYPTKQRKVPPWAAGLDMHGVFKAAWRANPVRKVAGKVAELHHDGRGRLCYGRPRNHAPAYDRVRQGWSAIAADFEAVDDLWYAQAAQSLPLAAVPPSRGGYLLPFTFPLLSVQAGERPGLVTNAGDHDAPVWVTFQGPSTNPRITLYDELGGVAWWLQLSLSLAADQSAVVDARSWVRSAMVNGTTPAFGSLRGASLADAVIPPGTFQIGYSATDATGTSSAVVSWRDTYTSL